MKEFIAWEALRGPADPDRLALALADAISRHPLLQQAIETRGRLWRASRSPASVDRPRVIELANGDLSEALEMARSAIDIASGRGIVALIAANSALLVSHPVVADGLSFSRIAREVDAQLRGVAIPAFHHDGSGSAGSPTIAGFDAAHWMAIANSGPENPWWVGPDEALPTGARYRARSTVGEFSEQKIVGTILEAARALSGGDVAIADVEIAPEVAGPLVTVPVAGRAGDSTIIGDLGSYTAYLTSCRPTAGGPGILVRRTVSPDEGPFDGIARGADRLYRVTAAWQRVGSETVLEVAAWEPGIASELVLRWASALSNTDGAHA